MGGVWKPLTCDCILWGSPVIVSLSGNGFSLTSSADGVRFDLNVDGKAESIAWTARGSDNAFLVLDRNANGTIDNGSELFGNFTAQPDSDAPNGFLALAVFDKRDNGGNADGIIDNNDLIFMSLRLWIDANHNGVSEPNELYTLPSREVASMSLNYEESRRRDQYDNQFRFRSRVNTSIKPGTARWAWDVFLVIGD